MSREIRSDGERTAVQLSFTNELMRTKQEFKDEVDINFILTHWKKTGHLNHTNPATPVYGDFANADDYLTAQGKLLEADAAFAHLPARIRERMGNSPAQFMAFMADESNKEEAIELGLAEAPTAPTPPAPVDGLHPPETLANLAEEKARQEASRSTPIEGGE